MRESSLARYSAIPAMSPGSISPNKCESASLVSAGLLATSLLPRSGTVPDGAIAFARPFCAAQAAADGREMRALLARRRIDLGDRDPRAFARKQNGRGAADPGARSGDQRHLTVETRHQPALPRDAVFTYPAALRPAIRPKTAPAMRPVPLA